MKLKQTIYKAVL